MLAFVALVGAVLPAPLSKAAFDPRPVVVGGSTANIIYGKLQRAAQLPTTRLSKTPLAAVDNLGALQSLLWSSFAMASVPAGASARVNELPRTRALEQSMLFIDLLPPEADGFRLPFMQKKTPSAPALDRALVDAASERGALHAYILLSGEPALAQCVEALSSSPLRATLIALEEGTTVASTRGWVCSMEQQDHDGALIGPLAVRNGWKIDEKGDGALLQPLTPAAEPVTLSREDLAELAVQCALRLSRDESEGCAEAGVCRVLRVGRGASNLLQERPTRNYDSVIGGAKTRERLGSIKSADWSSLLAPFGVVRESDPNDWRLLREV